MLQKRGQVLHYVYLVLIQIVLASTVALAFSGQLYQIKQSTYPEKLYLTRDLSTIMSGITGLPENIAYTYQRQGILSKYSINIDDLQISVEEYQQKRRTKMNYKFAGSAYMSPQYSTVIGQDQFVIFKDGISYGVQPGPVRDYMNQELCIIVPTTTTRFMMDPGHGSAYDLGYVQGDVVEKDITREIARVASAAIPRGFKVAATRELEGTEESDVISLKDRGKKVKDTDALVSVHLGNREEEKDYVRAYYDVHSTKKAESVFLTCNILNGFVNNMDDLFTVAMIPVDLELIDADDPLHILQSSEVGVFLEISTVHHKFVEDTKALGESIQAGFRGYVHE